jgi:hypothetical protein
MFLLSFTFYSLFFFLSEIKYNGWMIAGVLSLNSELYKRSEETIEVGRKHEYL